VPTSASRGTLYEIGFEMKMLKKIIILLLLNSTLLFCDSFNVSILKEGDLIFQETNSEQGKALKLATKSRYTHVGMLLKYNNIWYVFEAVEPVKLTPLTQFINRGVNNHFVVKRIKNNNKILTKIAINKIKRHVHDYLGKHYDIYFGWSDDLIYCTELIYKIFDRVLNIKISKLGKLRDFDLSNPRVKRLLRKRYGNKIPLNETVLSVSTLYNSDKLIYVISVN